MIILELPALQRALRYPDIVNLMRDALIAQFRGQCDTPMPMHLHPDGDGEVHMKSSYRRGGRFFALKVASTFPENAKRGLSTGNGMMLLASAETGEPVAILNDAGHLTDVRTAAVSAMVARELGREDHSLGIIGTGIQARLQALLHAQVLPLDQIWIYGRDRERAMTCRDEVQAMLPQANVQVAASSAEIALRTRLVVTATASRAPLLLDGDVQPGTLISAVGADSDGKQELDPRILQRAELLLADSPRQCQLLGELQHAPEEWPRVREIGGFLLAPNDTSADAITVCDFTGLGVEDLYIAEYCYERSL